MRRKTYIVLLTSSFLFLIILMLLSSTDTGAADRASSIGERFHAQTSITWSKVISSVIQSLPSRPSQYKAYPGASMIKLPKPEYRGIILEEAIRERRSARKYSSKPVNLQQLSQLLFAAQGVNGKSYGTELRTVPSAGALYPFEIYLVVNRVQGLEPGIYHYNVLEHELELVKSGKFGSKITNAGLKQDMLGKAAVTFVLSAIFDRTRHKYGERGFRYIYIEAGHISQNIYLQSISLGLGSVVVGAFHDDKVNKIIDVDGKKEAAIYLHAVGAL